MTVVTDQTEKDQRMSSKEDPKHITKHYYLTACKLVQSNFIPRGKGIAFNVNLCCIFWGVPSKSTKKQSKTGWEVRLETQIKYIRKQPK